MMMKMKMGNLQANGDVHQAQRAPRISGNGNEETVRMRIQTEYATFFGHASHSDRVSQLTVIYVVGSASTTSKGIEERPYGEGSKVLSSGYIIWHECGRMLLYFG